MSDDLRTDDDIARLFVEANPVPRHATGDGAGSRASAGRHHVVVDLDRPPTIPVAEDRRRRGRWLLAAAAAALVLGLAVASLDQDDPATIDGTATTAPRITAPDTLPATRLQVVDEFVAAVSAHDAAAVNRRLAPGAVPALVLGADIGDEAASLESQLAWLVALGGTWETESCREQGDTGVYCTIRWQDRLGELAGVEGRATVLFSFEDDLIDQVFATFDLDDYGSKAFRPFVRWVGDHHPDDVERLWRTETRGFLLPVFTSDAAELMDARLTEYVEAYAGIQADAASDVAVAEAFVAAFNARDESMLVSLVADPPKLAAELFGDTEPASQLAWFDAIDRRWTESRCTHEGEVVICRAVARDRLAEAAGIEVPTTIRISFADGRIDDVSVVADDGPYATGALAPFTEWIAATYPEDLRTMWELPVGTGWVVPNRDETMIPLFEARIHEWTSGTERPTPAHRVFLDALAVGDVESFAGLLAPDAAVDGLWATATDELPELSTLLAGIEWTWNVQSCSVVRDDPDPERPEIACVTAPTSRLEAAGVELPPVVVEFAFTRDGLAAVSTGSWSEGAADDLAPLFDWISTTHPDEADGLLAERNGVTVPVLADTAVERLLELVDDHLSGPGR